MKSRTVFVSLALGLGLALVVTGLLSGGARQVTLAQSGSGIIRVAPAGTDAPGCGAVVSPCRTVQYAVHQALPGEEVWVAAGIYTGVRNVPSLNTWTFTATQLVVITKSLTLRGGYNAEFDAWNPEEHHTVLDAQGQGRVIYIAGAIAPTVEALHITGGDSSGLGESVYYGDGGGGIFVLRGSAVISGNRIYGNTGYRGGGVWLQDCSATLRDNDVRENRVDWAGGAMWLYRSPATLQGNRVVSNTAIYAGGIALHQSDATLSSNAILSNTATSSEGGGVTSTGSRPILASNVVRYNRVGFMGGGVYLIASDAALTNNVIADNFADSQGSGLYIAGTSVLMIHNTIARNGGWGGGLYAETTSWGDVSEVVMTNTIVFSHTEGIVAGEQSTVTLQATLWHANETDYGGAGTISTINDQSGDPAFASDGYHLTGSSAAIDAGVNAGVSADIDGDPRPLSGGYDIGSDEFLQRVYLPLVVRNR